jgi:hypothetical protein
MSRLAGPLALSLLWVGSLSAQQAFVPISALSVPPPTALSPEPRPNSGVGARSSAGTGALVGAVVGLSAAGLFLLGFCSDPDTRCEADEYIRATIYIAGPPTLIGGLIGALLD